MRCVLGEPVFVPRLPNNPRSVEDDGWVLVQKFNPETALTSFVVLAAQDMTWVAEIHLGFHLPFGFHGVWVPAETLEEDVRSGRRKKALAPDAIHNQPVRSAL